MGQARLDAHCAGPGNPPQIPRSCTGDRHGDGRGERTGPHFNPCVQHIAPVGHERLRMDCARWQSRCRKSALLHKSACWVYSLSVPETARTAVQSRQEGSSSCHVTPTRRIVILNYLPVYCMLDAHLGRSRAPASSSFQR